jgi:hypothetical protein
VLCKGICRDVTVVALVPIGEKLVCKIKQQILFAVLVLGSTPTLLGRFLILVAHHGNALLLNVLGLSLMILEYLLLYIFDKLVVNQTSQSPLPRNVEFECH